MRLSAALCTSVAGVLLVLVTPVAAREDDNARESAPLRTTRVARMTKQDQQNVQLVIGQLYSPKTADVPLKLEPVREFYSQPTNWGRLDEKAAEFHLEAASMFAISGRMKGRSDLVSISDLAYRRVIDNTEGRTQLIASSDYCVQLLRQNRIGEALETMQNVEALVDDESLDDRARSRSLYNYGKAFELSGKFESAYEKYELAMKLDPRFTKAVIAAGKMARESRSESIGIPQTLAVTDVYLEQRDYDEAASDLRAAMQMPRWMGHDRHPQLVRQYVRYLTAARVDPPAFSQGPAIFLAGLARSSRLNIDSRQMIRHIRDIYNADLPDPNVDPAKSHELSDIWRASIDPDARRSPDRNEPPFAFLSDFLKMVGDYYYGQPDLESRKKSLTCYAYAWALNVKNMEAGLYLADTLLYAVKNPDAELDPNNQLLDAFIGQLFFEKNAQYRLDLGKDWERILKCHIVLASIFENKKQWGPPYESTTALFQWRMARDALHNLDRSKVATKRRLTPVIDNGLEKAQIQWNDSRR